MNVGHCPRPSTLIMLPARTILLSISLTLLMSACTVYRDTGERGAGQRDGTPGAPKVPRGSFQRGTPQETAKGIYHVVSKGQTLWRICYSYGVALQDVAEINNIKDPTFIRIGQKIFIPGAKKRMRIVPHAPLPRKGESRVKIEKGRFIWPLKGPPARNKLLSRYGTRGKTMHHGIDVKGARGGPVLASDDGRVVYSDDKLRGYGNVVIIEHKGNYFTVYAHNKRNLVKAGARVKKGARIATVGETGNATTPHVHFEIRQGRQTRNPLFFLP